MWRCTSRNRRNARLCRGHAWRYTAELGERRRAERVPLPIVIQDNVRLVVARKNHRADRSQGRLWRLGCLTGRDDDGVHDLVGEGLALGAVP